MRILVTGATGLIGSAVLARLAREGHETIAAVRTASEPPMAASRIVVRDFASAGETDWLPHLAGVDAVVNAAGVLQDGPQDSTAAVHVEGARQLFAACARAGVKRVIHVSAIGVDRAAPTAFSQTKRAGEAALEASELDWVILRPSVVLGPAAYGGSALIRGLAALPVLPRLPSTGPLQVVQLDEVVETILFFLRPEAPGRVALDLAGPERLAFADIVALYRRWLGWPRQRAFAVPDFMARLGFRLGDLAGRLGWRAPIRTTAETEIVRGAVGDNGAWIALTGARPRALADALAATPPSVQERWFAQLYLLKPVVFGVLALFWIATGLVALGPGWEIGMAHMRAGGAESIGPAAIVAGALADIAIGVGIAFRATARAALLAGIAISLAYAVIGTYLVPSLWADPLGPMLKIWPIIVLLLVALAIREDR